MTMRPPIGAAGAVVAGLAIALAGVWWLGSHRDPPLTGVVVITLDTTRADRLSPYGFMNVSLPSLERLAREGVVFDEATTAAPLTLPAHTSLFTGLVPPHHGVRDNADTALAESHTTLAEVLRARGFRTGAFVGSVVLDPDRGLAQGFEQYSGVRQPGGNAPLVRRRPGDAVMNDAIAWLDRVGGSPFFLWAHLYDAHRPYDPPEPYRSIYGHNLYVGGIAFADSQVGRLLEALEQRHLLDRTVVIVAADHGESLGDHGERDHGIFVYQDVIRVPLIMRAPGVRPARIGAVVRLTDVMPTILDLLGVPAPPTDGVSLVDLLRGRRQDLNLEAYSESLYPARLGWSPLRALRSGLFKLIEAPRPELYDLEHDPFEEHNIYESRRALAETMGKRLIAAAGGRGALAGEQPAGASAELQARLGALGYLATAVGRAPSDGSPLPDPKDCIGTYAGAARGAAPRPGCGPRRSVDDETPAYRRLR
jgi:arylsulfatase A-like enzyme